MTPDEVKQLIPSWIENSEVHICVVTDMSGNYTYVNELFKKRFAFIADDFIGMPSVNTYHPDDFEKSLQVVMECFGNPDKVVPLQIRKPQAIQGEYHWTNWEFSAFKNPKGEVVGIFCLGHDVTGTQDSDFIAKKYVQKSQAVIQNFTDGVLILDEHLNIISINKTIVQSLQIYDKEYVGKKLSDVLPFNHSFYFVDRLSVALNESSILTLEEYFDSITKWYSVIIFPNPEGLTVYFQDITAQKRLTNELELTQKQLLETSNMAKIGGWEYDVLKAKSSFTEETYRIHEVDSSFNPTIRNGISFYHPDYQEKIKDAFFKLLREGKAYDLELKFITAQKNEIWVRTMGKAIYENGKIIKLIGTLQNIDERKKQEEALLISQERLQLLADNVPGAIFQYILHPDGSDEIPFINIGSKQLWELNPEEVMKDTSVLWNTILPEYLPSLQESVMESAENQTLWQSEYQIKTPSGKLKWIEATGTPQGKLEDGAYLWHTLAIDITEKKSRTQELQKTKSLLDATNEIAQIGGWEYDIESDSLFWTEETYRIHELETSTPPDVTNAISFYHPEHQPIIQEAFEALLNTGEVFDLELKFITAKKNEIWVRAMGKAIYENDKVVKLLGTFQNIDSKKQQEEIIQEAQSRLNLIAENVLGAILQYKIYSDGRDEILYINASCVGIWEMTAEEMRTDIAKVWSMIYPDDLEMLQLSLEESAQNLSPWHHQWRIVTPSGKLKWLEVSGVPNLLGDATIWNTVITDITERKAQDEELKKIQNLLVEVGGMAKIGGWEYDIAAKQSFWTDETFRIYELEAPHAPEVEKGITFYHSDYQQVIADAFSQLLSTGKPYDVELKFITAKQKEIWVRSMGKAVYNNGKIEKLIGTFQDIDEKKKQEEEIRDSQQKLSAILNSAIDSNILIDLDYKVLACNRIAKEETKVLMGKEMQEGDDFKDFLAFFDQRISDVFYDAFNRAINGENFEIEEEIFFEDFSIWYRYKYDAVYDTSGDIIGVSLTSTNIDERKKAEEKVLQQNEILKEIAWVQSHKVRHPVANILGLVDLLKNDKEAGKELQEQFFDFLLKATNDLDEIIHEVVRKSEELGF